MNNSRKFNNFFRLLLFVVCVLPVITSLIMTVTLSEKGALEYEYRTVFGMQTKVYVHISDKNNR